MMMMNSRTAQEDKHEGERAPDRPRSTPPEPPPRRRYLQRPTTADDTTPQSVDQRPQRFDQTPPDQPRGLGPRWPSSPALGAHAQSRHDDDAYPLFLKRVVVAGDEYDDVIDDVSAYGLKRSK